MLKKWYQMCFILQYTHFSLHSSDFVLSKAYGISKIHKENFPFRIIVSLINTTLYPLAFSLHKIIFNSLTHDEHIKSFDFYKSLSD